jgi:glycosyltransferase involved in cell wall biosynthesis
MLAILTSHPIQYQVPLWRALAVAKVPVQVWFLTRHGLTDSYDAGFGRRFAWDLDMLGGYPHAFLDVQSKLNLQRFRGVRLRESLADRLAGEHVRALWIEGWRFQAHWQAIRSAHSTGTRVWLRGESNDLKVVSSVKSFVKRPVMGRFFRGVDYFLCIGSANRRLYESYGVAASRLHHAPYCVDNDRFRREAAKLKASRRSIRERWRIPAGAFCVLFCGKFVAKKRPVDVVAAVRRLESAETDKGKVHLLFVGSGELGAQLRRQCSVQFDADTPGTTENTDGCGPAASFVGFLNQTEITQAYVAADLLLLPSDSGETWGLVVNEAMACGTLAVVSDQCGCAQDLVAPVDRRLVFRCGDVDDLAVAIRHAMHAKISGERVVEISDAHHLRHTVDTAVRLYDVTCRV